MTSSFNDFLEEYPITGTGARNKNDLDLFSALLNKPRDTYERSEFVRALEKNPRREFDFLGDVTGGSPIYTRASGTEVPQLEATFQAKTIVETHDLRNALKELLDTENFTIYDLEVVFGIARSNVANWRSKPLDKLRKGNSARLINVIFAWKFWLHIAGAIPLGQHLRTDVGGLTLLDILRNEASTVEDVTKHLLSLAPIAEKQAAARLSFRQNFAGLPGEEY